MQQYTQYFNGLPAEVHLKRSTPQALADKIPPHKVLNGKYVQ